MLLTVSLYLSKNLTIRNLEDTKYLILQNIVENPVNLNTLIGVGLHLTLSLSWALRARLFDRIKEDWTGLDYSPLFGLLEDLV